MTPPKILAFTGSMRAESINRRLLLLGVERLRERGADVTEVQLRDFDMPVFSEDLEAEYNSGALEMPQSILTLRDHFVQSDGFLIASPEHNGAMTAAMKNTIDWCSRCVRDGQSLVCFRGKSAGLLAASPGKLGGIRGLPDLRRVLSGIGTTVIASDFACGGVPLDPISHDSGEWPDDGVRANVHRVADGLLTQLGADAK